MTTIRHIIRTGWVLLVGAALLLSLAVPALAQGASDRAPGRSGATPPGHEQRNDSAGQTPAEQQPSEQPPAAQERPAPAGDTPPGAAASEEARNDRPTPPAGRDDAPNQAPDNSRSTPPAPAAQPTQDPAPTTSDDTPATSQTTHAWNGRGTDSMQCDKAGDGPRVRDDGWIHWVFSTAGSATSAHLALSGSGYGSHSPFTSSAAVWHFFTPYFDVNSLHATLTYTGTAGPGGGLVISDYCPGTRVGTTPDTGTPDDGTPDTGTPDDAFLGDGPSDDAFLGDGPSDDIDDNTSDTATDDSSDETTNDATSDTDTPGDLDDTLDVLDEETSVLGVQEEAEEEPAVLDELVDASDDTDGSSPDVTPADDTEADVVQATETRPAAAALAYTGISALVIVAIGLGLTFGGGVLLRRRSETTN